MSRTRRETAARRPVTVFLRDLVLPCRIGIHQHERLARQRVRINLSLVADLPAALDDDLDNVLCYATLTSAVKAIVAEGHVNLVETLADRILAHCLADERVRQARVRIEKLDVFKEADSVGVEIERRR